MKQLLLVLGLMVAMLGMTYVTPLPASAQTVQITAGYPYYGPYYFYNGHYYRYPASYFRYNGPYYRNHGRYYRSTGPYYRYNGRYYSYRGYHGYRGR